MSSSSRTLAASVGTLLLRTGRTLSTAESCTGGMIGAAITAVPGSSRYFRGGVIAYDNAVKTQVLGVRKSVIDAHGAVSRHVVIDMARGVRRLLGTDCAIAVSGVAGPDGGTRDKPVGLVWIAVSAGRRAVALKCRFRGNRQKVRRQAVDKGFRLIARLLK